MLDHLLDGNGDYGIEGFYSKYHYKIGTVEKNAFGRWIVDNQRIKRYVQDQVIQPHYTGTNKVDPEAGVFHMGAMFQDGRFLMPYKNPSDREKTNHLINRELCVYPKGTCDIVMALWLAQKPLAKAKSQYRSWYTPGLGGRFVRNPAWSR